MKPAFLELADGSRLAYRQAGQGASAILFIHGNLAGSLWWEPMLERLPEGYRAYAIDLPGSGASPETGRRHTMGYFAGLVEQAREALGLTRFYLVGHSMGGGVAQVYTLAHPERVGAMALVDAMAGDGFHVLHEAGEARLRQMMTDREFLALAIRAAAPHCRDEALFSRLVEEAAGASAQVFLEQPQTMHEAHWMARLGELRCPVLFVHGAEDDFVPKDGSERTAAAIPGCVFKYLPGSGHSPNVEIPDRLAEEVYGFLAAHPL